MNPAQWHQFFLAASEVLGPGSHVARFSESWCSWTTFDRLLLDAGYWGAGIPARRDIFETHIGDGGVWGQPFSFEALAHLVVPREFYWESGPNEEFQHGTRAQPITALSEKLVQLRVPHRLTDLVLEVKCY
jgi:hypothetical protein